MGNRRPSRRIAALLAVGLALTGLWALAYATDALRRLELDTVDLRFSLRGEIGGHEDLVVVGVDDVTFSDFPQHQWPFPRSLHGNAIERLRAAGARTIAYDVQFTEESDDRGQDLALFDAAGRAGNVVFGTTEVERDGSTQILGGDENLRLIHAKPANTNLRTDPGGVIRRVDYSVDKLKSFPVVVAEAASGRRVDRDDFDSDGAWIDYHGPPGTIETVSFSRLLNGKLPAKTFRDKIVVIGAVAPTLQDVHPTSTSGDGEMPGPEIQASAISTVMRGLPLGDSGRVFDLAAILLLGMVAPLAGIRLSPLRALGTALFAAAVYAANAQVAFNAGTILPAVYPLGALATGTVATLGINYLAEVAERQRTRAIFARFVPEKVVDQVLEQTHGELRLGGERMTATVLFSDLREFTSFSEQRPAEQVIDILNRYLTEMSEAILAHDGTLVSYMGDGIMAVFGSPIARSDHADVALAAAREMLDERLPRFNRWLADQGLGEGFRMGIGLNSGEVMSGNVGSEQRLEYTAIGDTTNTAARLEGMTKGTPHQLFLSDSTRALLQRPAGDLVFVDEFEVRGREARIKVWSIPERGETGPAR